MLERFENIPDMLELDHLTVSGDVTFGKNVTLKVITGASECWDLETLEGVCQYIPRSLGPSKSDIEFVLVTFSLYTLEPPNKRHYEANDFVPCREVVPISEVK
jgi:hypothetical protein